MSDATEMLSPDEAQFLASDPNASVWVNASAGTGKTKVLTDRVLRLLLAGNAPERLLCITFTKAAAAEMAHRVQMRLGEWAALPEPKLDEALHRLTRLPVTPALRQRARRLFGLVVDAPGGLQINTIHAFCTAVLRRFPIEAGLSPQFEVISDSDSAALLARIKASLFRPDIDEDGAVLAALRHLAEQLGERNFSDLLERMIGNRRHFQNLFAAQGGLAGAIDKIRAATGLDAPAGSAELAFCSDTGCDAPGLRAILPLLLASKSAPVQQRAALLADFTAADPAARIEMLDSLRAVLLKSDGGIRQNLTVKDCKAADETVLAFAERLVAVLQAGTARAAGDHSIALLRVADHVLRTYQALKDQAGWLDYDDLVLCTRALLQDSLSAEWVMYRLDGGIDHILVDEAQDTNQAQWDIIHALCGDFFSGESARPVGHIPGQRRTLFVVGDDKQSIYSFQGAEPAAFHRMRAFFAERVQAAGHIWRDISLDTSFRSTAPVLGLVDHVFHHESPAHQGVLRAGQTGTRHRAHRRGMAGQVELWPLASPPEQTPPPAWQIPTQRAQGTNSNPEAMMAEKIAAHIRHLIDHDHLPTHNRRIRPGDFLILVRRRTAFVAHLIRALKQKNVPVAGIDRMRVSTQLAVQDLLVMARFVLLPDDDVNFACLLKTPLIGLDDDVLMALAVRGPGQSLWQAFSSHAETTPSLMVVRDWLDDWLRRADFIPPYEFFAQLLHQPCPAHPLSGRAAMIARLGQDILDPVEEFLQQAIDDQIKHPPLLEDFIHRMSSNNREIKRDADQSGNVVRIMTIHAAKGLQAPIVILPDTITSSTGQKDRQNLLWPEDPTAPFLWVPRKDDRIPVLEDRHSLRKQAMSEEDHRLLYVALTRAEDRLIITGYYGKNYDEERSWYVHIAAAIRRLAPDQEQEIILHHSPQTADIPPMRDYAEGATITDDNLMQAITQERWLRTAAPPPPARPNILSPSQAIATDTVPDLVAPPVFSPFGHNSQKDPFRRGILIHRLLQSLPEIAAPLRAARAEQFLARQAGDLPAAERQNIIEETLRLLSDPVFAPVFGPQSRAEVPLTGMVDGQIIAARLDRLVILEDQVLVVDFKTNRPPPTDPRAIPAAYRRQMELYTTCLRQLYPGHKITAALLWTAIPLLMPIPDDIGFR